MNNLLYQEDVLLLLRLIITYILAEFVFQPITWQSDKQLKGIRSSAYYKHILIVAGFTFISLNLWNLQGVLFSTIIALAHGLLDLWKIRNDNNVTLSTFIRKQILHLIILIISWIAVTNAWTKIAIAAPDLWNSYPVLLISLGYVFCIVPCSYIIRYATKEMITQDDNGNVKRGGRLIGIFERIIIFTFVLFHQYEAIGFLITGKSILRFGDTQKKETEYVLVGTMISYGLAIMAGVAVNLFRNKI